MKNKSNTHYTAPISVEITATAISREHVYFKNKHAGSSCYLASGPNTSLNFSSEEHEHPLKQKITTSWKSDRSGVLEQMEKREKKKNNFQVKKKHQTNPQNKQNKWKPFLSQCSSNPVPSWEVHQQSRRHHNPKCQRHWPHLPPGLESTYRPHVCSSGQQTWVTIFQTGLFYISRP